MGYFCPKNTLISLKNYIQRIYLPFNYLFTKFLMSFMKRWCKIYTKTDFWLQKSQEKFCQLQTSNGKSKKLKCDGVLLYKKYNNLAKTLYTEDLSTFQLLVLEIPYVIIETITHFSRHNSSVFF